MRKNTKEICGAVVLGMLMPLLILTIMNDNQESTVSENTVNPTRTTNVTEELNKKITVLTDDGNVEMLLEDYIVGVLLCEIPESFEMEAKKAQAVVARTYALRTVTEKNKHEDHAICTESACCQGYVDRQAYNGSSEGILEAEKAVEETALQVITYDGELIDATYFSCSGGMTETALAVWGADIPYLQAVSSPGEEDAAHYSDTVTMSAQEFQKALATHLEGNPTQWFGNVTYTSGGGIATMVIGGNEYTGTQLRELLQLRSTAFTIMPYYSGVTITTRGFGHRVGMSQYGAQAMAQNGKTYDQILLHYYTGTVLVQNIQSMPTLNGLDGT